MGEHPGGFNEDFRDLLALFVEEGVEFVVVGAHALAAAGVVRATKDIDLFVEPSAENARRVHAALVKFGAPLTAHGVDEGDFSSPGTVYQMGLPPRRIDVITAIDGVDFAAARAGRIEQEVDGLRLPFLGPRELVRNKRASGRTRDLLDLELLREAGADLDVDSAP